MHLCLKIYFISNHSVERVKQFHNDGDNQRTSSLLPQSLIFSQVSDDTPSTPSAHEKTQLQIAELRNEQRRKLMPQFSKEL